jgi:hypothetical protein
MGTINFAANCRLVASADIVIFATGFLKATQAIFSDAVPKTGRECDSGNSCMADAVYFFF